jgi:hypothetical protein
MLDMDRPLLGKCGDDADAVVSAALKAHTTGPAGTTSDWHPLPDWPPRPARIRFVYDDAGALSGFDINVPEEDRR